MRVRSIRFEPIGRCIYCGSDGGDKGLGEEHIVPFSLAGPMIIPEASCDDCGGKISFVEGHCARSMFKIHRVKGQYPTRRPKERPKTLPITFMSAGHEQTIFVPIDKFPKVLVMPQFQLPGMLCGRKPSTSWGDITIFGSMQKPSNFSGADAFRVSVNLNPQTFTRMLAKIAHCLAVVRYGVDGFLPFLTKHILDGDPYAPHLIGGGKTIRLPDPAVEHDLSLRTLLSDQKTKTIVAEIRLFAYEKTPTYTVVTGTALSEPRALSTIDPSRITSRTHNR